MQQWLFPICCSFLLACTGVEDAVPYVDGESLYLDNCAGCHGPEGEGSNLGPDLVWDVGEQTQSEMIETILEGTDRMDPIDVSLESAEAIATYVLEEIRSGW